MDGLKATLSFDAFAYDYDDEYLTIDTDTHTININNVSRLFGVQYDGNSKLIKFRIRNKLSDIQKMQDSIVYINWIDSRGVKGQSIAINKTINNDTCEFAWKVPFDALKNSGVLHFAMSAVVTKNSSSVIDQRWSTQIASVITPDGIYIKSYTPSSEEEDRIAQIYNELSNMINKQNDNLQSQISSLKEDIGDGFRESVSATMPNAGNYVYEKKIKYGTYVTIHNESSSEATINFGNEENEVPCGSFRPDESVTIMSPIDATKIRFYWGGKDIKFTVSYNGEIQNIENTVNTYNKQNDVTFTKKHQTANSWYMYTYIPKGVIVTFTNTNTNTCTLNVSDGTNELNVSSSLKTGNSITFTSDRDIRVIRCYQANLDDEFIFKYSTMPRFSEIEKMNRLYSGFDESFYLKKEDKGSHEYEIKITKGTLVEFENLSSDACTLNVSNESQEINIHTGVKGHRKYVFVCPIDATKIRNYWISNTVKFRIRNIGTASEKNAIENRVTESENIALARSYIEERVSEHNQNFDASGNKDSFIFFTDPHLYNNDLSADENIESYLASISNAYKAGSFSAVLCGGDWLGNGDSRETAINKLSSIDAKCKKYFGNYYNVIGNHDTNYQGIEELAKQTQANLLFRKNGGKTYFEFDVDNTHFFALDTDKDGDSNMLRQYDIEQLKWMSNILVTDKHPNKAILMHIVYYTGTTLGEIAKQIETLLIAFQERKQYSVDGETYDFSSATGNFKFVLAGHTHLDQNTNFGDVPVIISTTTRANGVPTFDLVCVDYGSNKIKLTRIGAGNDRVFAIPTD